MRIYIKCVVEIVFKELLRLSDMKAIIELSIRAKTVT
jgi:hypothetical protein